MLDAGRGVRAEEEGGGGGVPIFSGRSLCLFMRSDLCLKQKRCKFQLW